MILFPQIVNLHMPICLPVLTYSEYTANYSVCVSVCSKIPQSSLQKQHITHL